ncbi:hypothetical protein F442_14711 [Phytophthora nicotianae P10297]|uniref:Uncharacterized protein n=1 Tax=Phytophthora nicotianae P10297 TaxID=1317064 RepID=W2YRM6_PHYNI|nr:hypothetical protein F442_14711 [Phytophthora nicotianae P10297]
MPGTQRLQQYWMSQEDAKRNTRRIYQNFSTTFNSNHWPKARTSSIPVYGGNGSSGVKNYNTQWGYHPNQHDTRTNSVYSPSTTGKQVDQCITRKFNFYRPRQEQSSVMVS